MRYLIILLFLFPLFANGQGFPKKPTNYVTDDAHILSAHEAELLNAKLHAFEDSTSNQLFIYITNNLYGNLESKSQNIFNTWGIGQEDKDNGILIAIFINDRKFRIQVGYGLEAVLPSDLTRQIQDEEMGPRFKQTNYYEGIDAGVDKLIYYSKHAYTPPSPYEALMLPFGISYAIAILFFIINLFSLKKWNTLPKRKQKYLLLNILFLLSPIAIIAGLSFFMTTELYPLLVPSFAGTLALILLRVVINDTSDSKYEYETDAEYRNRMYIDRLNSRSDNSSSNDSFSGGGGGNSDSGGSSSSW